MKVNIHEAKTHFSKLLVKAAHGEEVVIAKAGLPVARLVPVQRELKQRMPGSAKGKMSLKKNFDAPLPRAVLKSFTG